MGYLDARAAVVASAERARGQEPIIFRFGPSSTSDGVARAEHSRGREMWLQWIASGSGSGWAFFDPAITGASTSSAGRGEAAPSCTHKLASDASAALQPATDLISTQRRSLDDFLAQVEAKYDGYSDLQSMHYQNLPVWHRD